MTDFDVLIIGGGAAGLTAAIFTARKKLRTAVITVDTGGQTNLTEHLNNYPGYEKQSGPELMKRFKEKAKASNAEIICGKVKEIIKKEEFTTKLTNNEVYTSKCIILAIGKVPKELNIPGEDKFLGREIITCTTKESKTYKNKNVVVIGGGNSAIEAVRDIAKVAKHVTLIHRRETFRADEVTVDEIKELENVSFVLNAIPQACKGKEKLETVIIKHNNGTTQEIPTDLVCIEIGYTTATKFIENLVKLNEKGEIIIDECCRTSQKGVLACGDATTVPYKQTIISAGEGAKAGLEAYRYLTDGKGTTIDWG